MATGALRFVELPFCFLSPLAAYIYDTTGNYQMAFLILVGRSPWPALARYLLSLAALSLDEPGFKQLNKIKASAGAIQR